MTTGPTLDYSNRNLRGNTFKGKSKSLIGANFSGANLQRANFEDVDLSQAHFFGADLRGANFKGAILRETDFSQATMGIDGHHIDPYYHRLFQDG